MKLAVVTNILTPYRVPLFEAMAKQVDDLTVFLMAKQEENRQWDIGVVPFKTELLNGLHFKPPAADISLHWNYGVIPALRRANPDVLMSGGFAPANIEAYLYCKAFGKPYVGWGEFTLRDNARSSPVRRFLRRWMISGSAASIASSTEARDAFLHYGAASRSILTSPMPVDVEHIHLKAQAFRLTQPYSELRQRYSQPIIMSVGRLTDRKGFRELLSIYHRVVEKRPEASLLLVGDGQDRPAYEAMVRDQGLRHVHFIGFVSQDVLPSFLSLADVFVFPTLSDTYGAVLAEAMAAELPVVSSIHAAATADLVQEGVNGYTMLPTAHSASADKILKILALTPEDRRQMGRAGYQSVKSTGIRPSAEVMVQFLRSLLIEPGGSSKLGPQKMPRSPEVVE